jgi:hypothetical protein
MLIHGLLLEMLICFSKCTIIILQVKAPETYVHLPLSADSATQEATGKMNDFFSFCSYAGVNTALTTTKFYSVSLPTTNHYSTASLPSTTKLLHIISIWKKGETLLL